MDLLNNQAGLKIADEVTSDLAACDVALDKARNGIHLGSRTNPARWTQRVDYNGNRIVYLHRKVDGKTVGALSEECDHVGWPFGGVFGE